MQKISLLTIVLLAIGAALGATARIFITWLPFTLLQKYVWLPILLINLLGSFLLGWWSHRINSSYWHMFLISGFLGSFTTFGTFIGHIHRWHNSPHLALLFTVIAINLAYICYLAGRQL
jgi:CrcB protein